MNGRDLALGVVGVLAVAGAVRRRGSRATARPPAAFRDLAAWTAWARTQGVELRLVRTPSYTVEVTDLFADTTGTGAGTRVLQALVQAADKAGMPLTLHPSSPRNVTFYERFGFVAGRYGEMRREPKRGSRATDPTSTPAFRRWFGDSQVVDAEGRPRVVYHGTTAPPFDAFVPRRTPRKEQLAFGFHFAEDEKLASQYAFDPAVRRRAGKGSAPRVIEAWLSLQNPFDATGWVAQDSEGYALLKEIVGRKLRPFMVQDGVYLYRVGSMLDHAPPERVMEVLRAHGYDGVKYTLQLGYATTRGRTITGEGVGWIAFDPSQIKSVDNVGRFDPADPRISYNRSPR